MAMSVPPKAARSWAMKWTRRPSAIERRAAGVIVSHARSWGSSWSVTARNQANSPEATSASAPSTRSGRPSPTNAGTKPGSSRSGARNVLSTSSTIRSPTGGGQAVQWSAGLQKPMTPSSSTGAEPSRGIEATFGRPAGSTIGSSIDELSGAHRSWLTAYWSK